jgi:hypothetical protein
MSAPHPVGGHNAALAVPGIFHNLKEYNWPVR